MKFEEMNKLSADLVINTLLPMLNGMEEVLDSFGDTKEDTVSPHVDTFICMTRCLVSRGWTINELMDLLEEHAKDQIKHNEATSSFH